MWDRYLKYEKGFFSDINYPEEHTQVTIITIEHRQKKLQRNVKINIKDLLYIHILYFRYMWEVKPGSTTGIVSLKS